MPTPSIEAEVFLGDAPAEPSTAKPDGNFQTEATGVVDSIRNAIQSVIVELGVRRAVDLQRQLQLPSTLSWQLFKVANERDVSIAGSAIPSRASMSRFITAAAKAGIVEDRVHSLQSAYDNFESLVKNHAGDRTSFNSLIAATSGVSEEWLSTDLQHRKNIFRGFSHVLGVQARARINFVLVTRSNDGNGFIFTIVSGFVGLRTLRPLSHVHVFGLKLQPDPESMPTEISEFQPLSLEEKMRSYCLEEFCSHPLPKIHIVARNNGTERAIDASLINPNVGNAGAVNVVFGTRSYTTLLPSSMTGVLNGPAIEVMYQDLLVQPGLYKDLAPKVDVFVGHDKKYSEDENASLPGDYRFEFLGHGPDVMRSPDVPHYPDMIRAAAKGLTPDLSTFEAWRCRVEFPVYHSRVRVELERPTTPDSI